MCAWAGIKRLCICVSFIIHVFLIKFHATERIFKKNYILFYEVLKARASRSSKYAGNNCQNFTVSQLRRPQSARQYLNTDDTVKIENTSPLLNN
jgi:hypothetical protein